VDYFVLQYYAKEIGRARNNVSEMTYFSVKWDHRIINIDMAILYYNIFEWDNSVHVAPTSYRIRLSQ